MIKHGIYGQSIIQVGDLGLGFYSMEDDLKNLKILNEIMEEHRCTFYAIRGNHDNPIFFDGTLDLLSAVKLLPDLSLLEIEGKKVFFCGGGISIDRLARTEGRDYWKEEEVDYDFEKLRELAGAEIVITHIAPTYAFPRELNDMVNTWIELEKSRGNNLEWELGFERRQIRDIGIHFKDTLKEWYYGHYHKNHWEYIDGVEYVCVGIISMYDTIKKEFIQ
jgi:predicted phosphodiesterase